MKGKQLLALLLAAVLLLGCTGCAAKGAGAADLTKNVKKTPQVICLDEDALTQTTGAMTGFGVKLLQNEMEKINPLLSPLSIASALSMISEPILRISAFKRPTALVSSSLRSEFEQTSSAKYSDVCAGVIFAGFIS